MKSASAKIIWRTFFFESLAIDFISPWTFDQIHIIWAMPITCSKSWATCCRTITPCCPIRAISNAISTRLCWALKLSITFQVFNFKKNYRDRIGKFTMSLSRKCWSRTISSFGFITSAACNRTTAPTWPRSAICVTCIWAIGSTWLKIYFLRN